MKKGDGDDGSKKKYTIIGNMNFCPTCANMLELENSGGRIRLKCRRCPYICPMPAVDKVIVRTPMRPTKTEYKNYAAPMSVPAASGCSIIDSQKDDIPVKEYPWASSSSSSAAADRKLKSVIVSEAETNSPPKNSAQIQADAELAAKLQEELERRGRYEGFNDQTLWAQVQADSEMAAKMQKEEEMRLVANQRDDKRSTEGAWTWGHTDYREMNIPESSMGKMKLHDEDEGSDSGDEDNADGGEDDDDGGGEDDDDGGDGDNADGGEDDDDDGGEDDNDGGDGDNADGGEDDDDSGGEDDDDGGDGDNADGGEDDDDSGGEDSSAGGRQSFGGSGGFNAFHGGSGYFGGDYSEGRGDYVGGGGGGSNIFHQGDDGRDRPHGRGDYYAGGVGHGFSVFPRGDGGGDHPHGRGDYYVGGAGGGFNVFPQGDGGAYDSFNIFRPHVGVDGSYLYGGVTSKVDNNNDDDDDDDDGGSSSSSD